MKDLSKEKLVLNYPCNWIYKLIVKSELDLKLALNDILENRDYKLTSSNFSKKSNFQSFNLDILVHNEDDRKLLYEILYNHPTIKMVL
jgi:uncharacterized protein